MKVEM